MPSGATVNRDPLFALVATAQRDDLNLAAAEYTVGLLLERAVKNQEDAAGIAGLARDLNALIGHRIALGETSIGPSDLKSLSGRCPQQGSLRARSSRLSRRS